MKISDMSIITNHD